MIPVTRINGEALVLNSDLIEHVEAAHDTIVTLANGQRYVVQESPDELIDRVVAFRRAILNVPGTAALGAGRGAWAGMHPASGTSRAGREEEQRGQVE